VTDRQTDKQHKTLIKRILQNCFTAKTLSRSETKSLIVTRQKKTLQHIHRTKPLHTDNTITINSILTTAYTTPTLHTYYDVPLSHNTSVTCRQKNGQTYSTMSLIKRILSRTV